MKKPKHAAPTPAGPEIDVALHVIAQGNAPTSDDAAALGNDPGSSEIDDIGRAAGIPQARDQPVDGADPIAARDAHRWELDPASADDASTRHDLLIRPPVSRRQRRPAARH